MSGPSDLLVVDALRLASLVVAAEGGLGVALRLGLGLGVGSGLGVGLGLGIGLGLGVGLGLGIGLGLGLRVRVRDRVRVRVVAAEGSLHLGDRGRYREIWGDMGRWPASGR